MALPLRQAALKQLCLSDAFKWHKSYITEADRKTKRTTSIALSVFVTAIYQASGKSADQVLTMEDLAWIDALALDECDFYDKYAQAYVKAAEAMEEKAGETLNKGLKSYRERIQAVQGTPEGKLAGACLTRADVDVSLEQVQDVRTKIKGTLTSRQLALAKEATVEVVPLLQTIDNLEKAKVTPEVRELITRVVQPVLNRTMDILEPIVQAPSAAKTDVHQTQAQRQLTRVLANHAGTSRRVQGVHGPGRRRGDRAEGFDGAHAGAVNLGRTALSRTVRRSQECV